jgi:hypothetical protein
MYGSSREDIQRWREALLNNGAKWEEQLVKTGAVNEDGSVETIFDQEENRELQEAYLEYKKSLSPTTIKEENEDKQEVTQSQSNESIQSQEAKDSLNNDFSNFKPDIKDISFITEKINGSEGTLIVKTNSNCGIACGGVITLKLQDGSWKVVQESWHPVDFIKSLCIEELHAAVVDGNLRKVKRILESSAGVSPNDFPITSNGSPLITAVSISDVKMSRLLLSKGADPNLAAPSWNDPPLFLALQQQNQEIVSLLIKYYVNLQAKNHDGQTPGKVYLLTTF